MPEMAPKIALRDNKMGIIVDRIELGNALQRISEFERTTLHGQSPVIE